MSVAMTEIYLLKDLARITGYSIYTIKYYLKIGLIKEVSRSPGTNFRYFDDSTVEQLKKIRNLRLENKSIQQIKDVLGIKQ
jgi:DNA-binding transcriptional MerR regulator